MSASRLRSAVIIAAAVSVGLLASGKCIADTPDHYGVYLVSKAGQEEIIDVRVGFTSMKTLMEHFAEHPASTPDSGAHLLVYNPDFKPTQMEVASLFEGERQTVATYVKPIGKDQYEVRTRTPLEKGLYIATYELSVVETVAWLFAVGEKEEVESLAALFKKGNEKALDQAKAASQCKGCVNNLRIMDAAKEQAAMEEGWKTGHPVISGSTDEQEVLQFVSKNKMPVCSGGGTYTWNSIGTDPTCTIPGHGLAGGGESSVLQTPPGAESKSATTPNEPAGAGSAGVREPSDNPVIVIETSVGSIRAELWPAKAPASVANILAYVRNGFYDGTVFHRVIKDFMIQGGGFTPEMTEKRGKSPVKNEARADTPNVRGTLAMARTAAVDSATCQFFINLAANSFLNHQNETPQGFGYCVFGRVTEGMDVVDRIAQMPTGAFGPFSDVPQPPVVITSIRLAESVR